MDLSQSVLLPREDFVELQAAAWNQPPATPIDRVATVVQTAIVCAILGAAFAGGTWAWVKATNWREEQVLKRMNANPNYTRPLHML